MNIQEGHVRRGCANPADGGSLAIETSVREKREKEKGERFSPPPALFPSISLILSLISPFSVSQIKWSRLAPAAVIMTYTMTVSPAGPHAVRVFYEAAVDTTTLPLPPPIRAVIETSMAASFQALVGKFVAFAAEALEGQLLPEGEGLEEEQALPTKPSLLSTPHLLSPRAAASPRVLAPPAPARAAAWSTPSSRHLRWFDTEGDEYADAAGTTPRGLEEASWEGAPPTPTACA